MAPAPRKARRRARALLHISSTATGVAVLGNVVQGNAGLAREVLDGRLGGVTIPTLVVWGQHDRLIPLPLGERFAREIPGARLVVVPDTGHAPMKGRCGGDQGTFRRYPRSRRWP